MSLQLASGLDGPASPATLWNVWINDTVRAVQWTLAARPGIDSWCVHRTIRQGKVGGPSKTFWKNPDRRITAIV